MKQKTQRQPISMAIRAVIVVYAIVMVVLVLLAASNYPVQWHEQVNFERQRYIDTLAQAIDYYYQDHDSLPALPATPSIISNTDQCSAYCPTLRKTIPCVNLGQALVPNYMTKLFQDPLLESNTDSGFYVVQNGKTVELGACFTFFNKQIIHQSLYR